MQLAFKPFSMHDQTFDAVERSLGARVQLPRYMLLEMPDKWDLEDCRDPEPNLYASKMGQAADLVKFNRLVVGANIRFVANDPY